MLYQGRYKPKNPQKYKGDPTTIIYRSFWEFSVMNWCDTNSDVLYWSSEEIMIPYVSIVDKKAHRYFPDFKITLKDKKTYIIEVKPNIQTKAPNIIGKSRRRYIKEVLEYGKNVSKWNAAQEYAKNNGYIFQVWTEEVLGKLGISIIAHK